MATAHMVHMVSCHILSTARSKKSKPVCLCLSSRSGRVTCSQNIHLSKESKRSISLFVTRVHAALEKMTSPYLKKEFRISARRFLEEFTNTVLSTVAARSKLGQGISCFCPEIIIGGDDHSAIGQLLDGLISCGWENGSTVEACKAEFKSFVKDQRQLECHGSRRHSDISNVLGYLIHQSGFRSRRHLYRVSLVGFQVGSVAAVKH